MWVIVAVTPSGRLTSAQDWHSGNEWESDNDFCTMQFKVQFKTTCFREPTKSAIWRNFDSTTNGSRRCLARLNQIDYPAEIVQFDWQSWKKTKKRKPWPSVFVRGMSLHNFAQFSLAGICIFLHTLAYLFYTFKVSKHYKKPQNDCKNTQNSHNGQKTHRNGRKMWSKATPKQHHILPFPPFSRGKSNRAFLRTGRFFYLELPGVRDIRRLAQDMSSQTFELEWHMRYGFLSHRCHSVPQSFFLQLSHSAYGYSILAAQTTNGNIVYGLQNSKTFLFDTGYFYLYCWAQK